MAKQSINIGSSANDGTGTPLRDAFDICNDNFTEIYAVNGGSAAFPSLGSAGQVLQVNSGGTALEFAAGSSVSDLNDLSDVVVNNTDENSYFINIPASRSGDLGNLSIGKSSLNALTSGDYNTAIGASALNNLTTSEGVTAIGYNAGTASGTTLMAGTTLIGRMAGFGRSGFRNVAIGDRAMGFGSGKTNVNKNTAIGYHALYRIDTNGVNNIAIGHEASQFLTTAEANVAIGDNAARSSTADGHISIGYEAGYSNTSGTENTNIGYQTGYTNSTSGSNTNVGHQAAYYTTGQQLAAFGYRALFGSSGASSGSYNSAFGREAGVAVTSGSQNTLLGAAAGKAITTGANNTVIGSFAAFNSLIDGDNNIVIGKEAAPSATGVDNEITLGNASITALRIPGLQSGASDGDVLTFSSGTGKITLTAASGGGASDLNGLSDAKTTSDALYVGTLPTGASGGGAGNTTLGKNAGVDLNTGSANVIIGNFAAGQAVNSTRSVAIGQYASFLPTNTYQYNIGIGWAASYNASDNYVIGIGDSTFYAASGGEGSIAIGSNALRSCTADRTIAIGYQAAYSQTSGTGNTAVGERAAYSNTTGENNTSIGDQTAYSSTGSKNTSVGKGAFGGGFGHSGSDNVAIGYLANQQPSGASNYNVAIGSEALRSSGTRSNNVAIGYKAGTAITSGGGNTLVGYLAGEDLVSGVNNVAIGQEALKSETNHGRNVAVGYGVLQTQNAGAHAYNVGIGYSAGGSVNTGKQNTFLGGKTGEALTTGDNNTIVGYNSSATAVDVDNEFTLGNSSIATLRCQQTSITSLSDQRDKKDIETIPYGLDFVNSLQPKKFIWDNRAETDLDGNEFFSNNKGKKDIGFIAQELQNVDDDYLNLVYDSNPEKLEATYGRLIPVLVKAIQDLSAKVTALENA